MYSQGSFENPTPEVHAHGGLPNEVFLLHGPESVQEFLDTKKDLAIGETSYPKGYDARVQEAIDSDIFFECEVKSLTAWQEEACSLSKTLLLPFWSFMTALEDHVPSRKRVLVKVVRDQMCPLFHVDKMFARMIVTLSGTGTQWLQDKDIYRKNLNKGGKKPIIKPDSYLQQILAKQVAILKGSRFSGSKGLVHRSPAVAPGSAPRLMVRVDYL